MLARLTIDVTDEVIERARAELAVVFHFVGDRPPRGDSGRADWRLCGRLSQLIRSGRLRGIAGEALLMPTGGGLLAPLLLCLGGGSRAEFDARACVAAGRDAAERALRLQVRSLALSLPDPRSGDLALSLRVESLFSGVIAAVADNSADLRLRLVVPLADDAPTRKALAVLAPRFRSAALILDLSGTGGSSRVRPSPQGVPGSSPQVRQGIK